MGEGSGIATGLGPSVSEVKVGSPSRKKMRLTVNAQGLPNGRGQIGDDLILDDGIAPKTVTIEQSWSFQISFGYVFGNAEPGAE